MDKVDLSRSLTEERICDSVLSDRSITTSPSKGMVSDKSLNKGEKDNKVMFILSDAEDSPETTSLLHSEHKVS